MSVQNRRKLIWFLAKFLYEFISKQLAAQYSSSAGRMQVIKRGLDSRALKNAEMIVISTDLR